MCETGELCGAAMNLCITNLNNIDRVVVTLHLVLQKGEQQGRGAARREWGEGTSVRKKDEERLIEPVCGACQHQVGGRSVLMPTTLSSDDQQSQPHSNIGSQKQPMSTPAQKTSERRTDTADNLPIWQSGPWDGMARQDLCSPQTCRTPDGGITV
jgi:hypothetical protein